MKKMDKRNIAYYIIGFTGVFAIVMLIIFLIKTTPIDINLPIDTNIISHYGAIVGGISAALLSLASVLLIIQSIDNQEEQRKTDKKENEKQQKLKDIETRFYQLIKLHRDNVSEFQSKGKIGRQVIIKIYDEYNDLYKFIKLWYTFEKSGLNNKADYNKNVSNIAYYITFFGLGNNSTKMLLKLIKEIVGENFFDTEFYRFALKTMIENHIKIREENRNKPISQRKYIEHDGHQSRLGHYFRHLFQTVKYINEQPSSLIDYKKKYEYIKTLRAQLSNFEQALLFINSLSKFGLPWEFSELDNNKKLITKYNLIKNIPVGLTDDLYPKDYYPDVFFESDENKTENRKKLENTYS